MMYSVTNGKKEKQTKTPAFLESKDEKNDEKRQDKTIEDIKKLIPGMEYNGEFSADEEMMMYFNMLSCLKHAHFELVGLKKKDVCFHLDDKQRLKIISNLTDEIKTLIKRDFISDSLAGAYNNNAYGDFLMKFTRQVKEVEKTHQDTYDSQRERLDERKAVAKMQLKTEKAKEKAKKLNYRL